MDPTPEVLAAADTTRKLYEESPVWSPALANSVMRTPSASVEPLAAGDIHYFLFEFSITSRLTARFAFAPDGELLEAEGVKHARAALRPFIDSRVVLWLAAGRSLRQVWMPCRQTTTRLLPLWELSAGGVTRYLRADGVFFEQLTINVGRG